jgi:hypothetical protein
MKPPNVILLSREDSDEAGSFIPDPGAMEQTIPPTQKSTPAFQD